MSFDPTFTYALEYFDGLMGTFFPTVMKIAWAMAFLGIVWNAVQVAFGTMESRKFAVGTMMRFVVFWLALAIYPILCPALRSFALGLGELAGKETTDTVVDSLQTYIKQMESDDALLTAFANGDKSDATSKALVTLWGNDYSQNGQYDGANDHDVNKIAQALHEHDELKKSIDEILPKGSDGKRYLNLEFVKKNADGSKKTRTVLGEDGKPKRDTKGQVVTEYAREEGLLSLDTTFKLAYLCATVMRNQAWKRDVIKSSSDKQAGGFLGIGKSDAEKLEKEVKKTGGNYEDAFSAAVEIGKIGMTLTSVPVDALLRYFEVLVCSIFVIILTCVCLIQYTMHMVEYNIVTGFSIVLIPLALFDGLKDYAMKIIAMLFAEAVKLSMLVMMMYYNFGLYGAMCKVVLSQHNKAFGLAELSFVIFSAILGFALVSNAPKLASTIVSGQPQMSMGEFVGAAGAIGGGAFVGAKIASAPAVAAGKGIINGGISVANVRAGGGSWGKAFASGAANAALTAAGSLMGTFSRGGGSPRVGQTTEFTKAGREGREARSIMQTEKARAHVSEKMGGNGSGSGMNSGNMYNRSNSEAVQRSSNAETKASDASSKASAAMQKADAGASGGIKV